MYIFTHPPEDQKIKNAVVVVVAIVIIVAAVAMPFFCPLFVPSFALAFVPLRLPACRNTPRRSGNPRRKLRIYASIPP